MATTLLNGILDDIYKPIQLSVGKAFEDGNLAEVYLHFSLLALLLLSQEIVVIFVQQVEKVRVLHGPHGSVTPTLSHVAQVRNLFV